MHWITCLEGGPRRVNHAAASVGNLIYSFGGYCTGEDSKEFRPMDVHVLCTENLRWVYLPIEDSVNVPFKRYGHTAVSYGTNIYIWGGRNDENACNVLYCFDSVTNSWKVPVVSGSVPSARDGHSACLYGHNMYIFGGFEEDDDSFSQEVYMLDLESMCWSYVFTLGVPPSFRDFHSAVVLLNRMYIFGGRGDCGDPYNRYEEVYSSHIYYLDFETERWHKPCTFGDEPTGRRSHSAFVHNGNMYIFGGYNGKVDRHFNEMYRYNPQTSEWRRVTAIGAAPCERRRQSCVVVNDRMYLFGGTSPRCRDKNEEREWTRRVLLENYSEEEYDETADLQDHSDLHVLDFRPTLRSLAMLAVMRHRLDWGSLPLSLQYELLMMVVPNRITCPTEAPVTAADLTAPLVSQLDINC